MNLQRLTRDLRREAADRRRREEVSATVAIVRQHARPGPYGKPMRCVPAYEEEQRARRYGRSTRNGGQAKVIYDSREAAEAARRALEAAGAEPLYAYPCPQSRHGHHHLARLANRRPPADD